MSLIRANAAQSTGIANHIRQAPVSGTVRFNLRGPGGLPQPRPRIVRLPPTAASAATAFAATRPGSGIGSQHIIRLPPTVPCVPAAPQPRPPPSNGTRCVAIAMQGDAKSTSTAAGVPPKKILSTPELPVGSKVSTQAQGGRFRCLIPCPVDMKAHETFLNSTTLLGSVLTENLGTDVMWYHQTQRYFFSR